ncbi:MAG TPA: molybdopterin-dependent oxidoreductase [Thermoanaerobaculia bacterium]|nr:molybdopterin-dependent oxidoreductase [Thermoanaerobaculia bacterium]
MSDEREVSEKELKRITRRGFFTAGVAALAGFGGYKWLRSRSRDGGLEWPLRRALDLNQSLGQSFFSSSRLSPTFRPSDITRARINGRLGLKGEVDASAWRLVIAGAASPVALTLAEVMALPRYEMITELRCIEGWSTIVQWAGARLADLVAKFPPAGAAEYIAMETPDCGYYVGLDMDSALHPQTLLAWEMNGQPLTREHGAPLRLAIPVKYGIKNIKRIGVIRYAATRPADFWGERGYDWYAGH